jgi:cytochrome o ubiquinol oxidase operon protein cyoD
MNKGRARAGQDKSPGDHPNSRAEAVKRARSYVLGLVLAVVMTAASFWVVKTHLIYGPGVPVALVTLAIAQMGIHLVFFLHITTAPDNTNTVLALAFGLLIVCLVMFGSLWIMANMNHNMNPMSGAMRMGAAPVGKY